MRRQKSRFYIFYISSFCSLLSSIETVAQIIPDASLPNNSQVINQENINTINGGTRAGNNLFHSFESFSVTTGDTAHFNNAIDIQNIFSRVTGSSISNIDGVLRANGTVNLFLLNPNGIVFGPNASLDLGGSFIATTANSIKFADTFKFSAAHPQSTPLLTISVPIGLEFGSDPGSILVKGTGHSLTTPSPLFSPILGAGASSTGLRVSEGKTLALVGGNINLVGGVLTAPGGQIELGSVRADKVNLNSTSTGWILNYKNVQNFRDISLSQQALIDTSGISSGSIQVVGRQISLADGAVALIQNQGDQFGGSINVNASEFLKLSEISSDGKIGSGLLNETIAGTTGDTNISTKNLVVENGAVIYNKTFTESNGGNIIINAPESIQILGFSSANTSNVSGIGSYTFSSGNSGKIVINTGQLTNINGGTVLSGTFATGKSGSLTINATQGIQLSGFNPFTISGLSQLSVGSFNNGDAGNLTINTPKIFLQNGGSINSYAFASGNAGNIIINAFNSIDITREGSNGLDYSLPFGISSYATPSSSVTQQEYFNVPISPNGKSGDLTVNTTRLNIKDGGIVNVSNLGNGDAGNLRINANKINLDNNGGILAATVVSGEGGNIFLNSSSIQLHENSRISASASGDRDGGNIDISARIITLDKGSEITANAIGGRGGNIRINALGMFLSSDSKITASSQFGLNGNIQINALFTNYLFTKSTPETIIESPKIASTCEVNSSIANKFVVIGTGSVPRHLEALTFNSSGWNVNLATTSNFQHPEKVSLSNQEIQTIVEAQSVLVEPSGKFNLLDSPDKKVANVVLGSPNSFCFPMDHQSTSVSTSTLSNKTQE